MGSVTGPPAEGRPLFGLVAGAEVVLSTIGLALRPLESHGDALSIPARVKDLEAPVQENRRLNRRIAELTDVVAELLVPLADRDVAFLGRGAMLVRGGRTRRSRAPGQGPSSRPRRGREALVATGPR